MMEEFGNGNNVPYSPEIVLNGNLGFWMTQLPQTLKNLPINHLAIPGTIQL